MANIRNEIVKFIADVELDPQDAAKYTEGLQSCEKAADALRKSIAETESKMKELSESGQESSEQFAALKRSLDADCKALNETTKKADKYAQALGINSMSLNQLQKHAKQVRQALGNLHKESDPKVWQKYQKELKATEDRIKELKGGGEKAGGTLAGLGSKIAEGMTVAGLAMKAFNGVVNLAKKGFETFTKTTQTWADAWDMTMAVTKAGWEQFVANIGQGSNVMKASIREAMQAAREAQLLRDELFERNNSFKLMEADAKIYINTQMEIANNSAKSAEERMTALNNVMAKETELAESKKSIAEQEKTAALDLLKTRAKMTDDELKWIVDNYEANRELINQAGEYNELLARQDAIRNNMRFATDQWSIKNNAEQLQEVQQALQGWDASIVEAARLTRQYNLANDELVKGYVDASLAIKQADVELTAAQASQGRKRGTLQKQIDADNKAAADKAYQDRITTADKAYKQEILLLKQQLADKQITESEFNIRSEAAELSMLNNKIAINKAYGKDITDFETTIADKRLATQRKLSEKLKKEKEEFNALVKKMTAETEAESQKLIDSLTKESEDEIARLMDELPEDVDIVKKMSRLMEKESGTEKVSKSAKLTQLNTDHSAEMADLESLHDMQLISEEEYLARKKQMNEDYAKAIAEVSLQTWQSSLDTANQFLDAAGNMVSAMREAEMSSLDAQMEAELAAAGDNAEERERIEAEYEQKKLDTQKKYADVDMAIQIAKTIAAGALAAIQSFAQLGPIAGAVMAAVIAATTAAEVATIVQQRNAIKNKTVNSAGGSSSGAGQVKNRELTGYSEGGYTGDGGRLEPAGVVHRGEYVVAAPELRDPSVAREVARIESKRRSRLNGRRSTLPGYADGGYTSASPNDTDGNILLLKIYRILEAHLSKTPMAYVVLSQLQAQEEYQKRIKSKG